MNILAADYILAPFYINFLLVILYHLKILMQ